jgi:hypothetical protein
LTDARLLEINHKNGGGTKESRTTPDGSIGMYRRIVDGRRGIDDLELLCKICNTIHLVELMYPEYRGRLKLTIGSLGIVDIA